MDFFKNLLPPLKIPKLKKLKQWNGASILNLNQLKNLPSRSRNVGTVASVVRPKAPAPPATSESAATAAAIKGHSRKRSDISIISASVPPTKPGASGGGNGNYGLYALKCDRNAAKRGILLNLPRKMVAAMGGGGSGGEQDSCSYQSEEMVHEKFSPCKRVVEPPPRRKRLRKRGNAVGQNPMVGEGVEGKEFYCGDRLLERNRSELFRIAERGSNEHLNRVEDERALPPPPGAISGGRKTLSVDNLLALKRYGEQRDQDSDSDAEQVRSLKVSRMAEWKGPVSVPLKYSESIESDSEEIGGRVRKVTNGKARAKKASEYSIENNSEEIEVRVKGNGSTESEEVVIKAAPPVPLPTRVVALRQEVVKEPKPKVAAKPKLPEKPPPKKQVEKFVTSKDFAENFKPLAAVLQESIKSADLKRKWINDFLSESDDEPARSKPAVKKQQSTESLSKKFALVDRFDRQLEELEGGGTFNSKDSVESVNIFHHTNGDFDEFDKLFHGENRKKSVTVSEQVTFINQQPNLHFSSSSFDSDVVRPPVPPPLPPPVMSTGATPKSTVKIQDYYDKKLQRVRYVSSPSPSRCFDEDPSPPPLEEAVNNNLVLPLSIINRTVDKCITEQKKQMQVCSVNGPKQPYNQHKSTTNQNNHISCNLNNIPANYIETPCTNPDQSSTNNNNNNINNSASVFIVGETFKRCEAAAAAQPRQPVKRYINYKFDDYCHITTSSLPSTTTTTTNSTSERPRRIPPRTFNINDFHDDCYNEEGVVII